MVHVEATGYDHSHWSVKTLAGLTCEEKHRGLFATTLFPAAYHEDHSLFPGSSERSLSGCLDEPRVTAVDTGRPGTELLSAVVNQASAHRHRGQPGVQRDRARG